MEPGTGRPGRWPPPCCGPATSRATPPTPAPTRTRSSSTNSSSSKWRPTPGPAAPSRSSRVNCARPGRPRPRPPARVGVQVAALATSPIPVEPEPTTKPRYRRMAGAFGLTAQEQLTCGCHVHVQIDSDEEGVAVLDRIQPWLAGLLALSGNSPFWQGLDSSYASFRYQAWGRWPCSGPTGWFGSARGLPGHGGPDGGHRDAAGQRHGVLRRAALPALPHARGADRRRLPAARGRGAGRRAGAGPGGDGRTGLASGRGTAADAPRTAPPRSLAGQPVRVSTAS